MKILQIINSLGTGGAEKLLLETVPLYNKRGISVDVLVLWNNNHQFINSLRSLQCCKVFVLKDSEKVRDVYNPFHIFAIKNILKDYDLAHVHLFPAQYFVPLANMLNGNRTKLIFTEHNTSNNRLNNSFFNIVDKFFYTKYKKQVSITNEIQQIFQNKYGFPSHFYKVIENGVNLEDIKNAVPFSKTTYCESFKETDKVIVQISAFREQKDQDTLIRALTLLPNNFKLLFVGDGLRRSICEELVKQLNLENRVKFLGQRMDIPQIMKSVDYIVLSSRYEGLSLASIEGLASGKPFIASDVPGLKEIVKDAGLLFEFQNSKQLASLILHLENNPLESKQVIEKSMLRAQQYDITHMIDNHIQLYREVYEG